jgi:hypothetical protein
MEMDRELHMTLFDALKGQESHFENVVRGAIEAALIDLGDQIYALDWANTSVCMEHAKAA